MVSFSILLLIYGLQLTVTELTLVLPVIKLMVIGSCTARLDVKELPVVHTANNIGEKIEEVLNEWNIGKDIIVAAVTDNARNS